MPDVQISADRASKLMLNAPSAAPAHAKNTADRVRNSTDNRIMTIVGNAVITHVTTKTSNDGLSSITKPLAKPIQGRPDTAIMKIDGRPMMTAVAAPHPASRRMRESSQ
jgi:hypothetical protein